MKSTTGNIESNASAGKISAAGLNVALEAQAEFKASGNVSASLQTSGQCVVKGAVVMIN